MSILLIACASAANLLIARSTAASGMMLYCPPGQNIRRLSRSMCLAVRVAGNPNSIAAPIRQELRAIDPRLRVAQIDAIGQQLDVYCSRST